MAKKANHDGGLDRISNLPDSVLSRVLSCLPIKDLIRTSILSTRWRHLFASVFNLDVDFLTFRRTPRKFQSPMNLLDKMLFLHEGNIEQVRLNRIDKFRIDPLHICGWVSAALWRGVKGLDLSSSPKNRHSLITLPSSLLFSSKTLVRLKLEMPFSMSVPICVCLPSLKTLELRYIKFEDDDSVGRLISGCPILEGLSISDCGMLNITPLKISSPSLKSLTLGFSFPNYYRFAIAIDLPSLVCFKYCNKDSQDYSMVNVSSLVTADIDISYAYQPHGLVQLFEGFGNVKSLHLSIYSEALSILSRKCLVPLENLVELQIEEQDEWQGKGLFEFLEIAPNLQTLAICKLANEVSFPREKVPSCVSCKLKEFIVLDFKYEKCLFKLVTYILNNATLLEKLKVFIPESLNFEERFRITNELLRIPRSSNKCQLLVL